VRFFSWNGCLINLSNVSRFIERDPLSILEPFAPLEISKHFLHAVAVCHQGLERNQQVWVVEIHEL